MHPSEWMDPGVRIELTKKEKLEHAVACFHFLLEKPGKKVQQYTTGELADAICAACDIEDPRTAWTVEFLRSFEARILVHNYWGV